MSSRRSANFTHHEKEILLSLMQTYRHVVEDKRTDGIMVKEKNAAWIELTNKYNAQNEVWTRSVKQLRQCWKNLKSRARIDLMRVNLQTSTSDSDPNSVRLKLVPLNNVSKPTDNSNQSTLNSSNNNNNNNTTGNIINNNNNNNINNANNNNATNIILSSILNNNNNNINNSNTIKSGSVPSYGSRLQALSSTTGSNSVVGLSPSLLSSGGLSNRPNSKTSGSKKRKKKKVVLNDVSSRNFATNDNNSNSNNSTSSSRRQQRLLTVASATIGVERDDIDDEDDVDDDDEEDDAVAVLAADNDDDSNTIGARRRRRRRLHPTSKSTSIGDSALLDVVADENDEFEDDENEEEEEEEEEEDEDEEGDDNDEDDDDDIDDSGTDDDVRRSSRQHRSGVNVDSFQVEQNSDPSSQGVGGPSGTAQDVDPLYTIENLAVVSVSGSADRIHFQHHANSPTSDLQNQTDGNLLHSHHPHQLHQSQHHQQQPPHLHSQVNNYHHSNRLSADSITRLDDNFSTTEPDIKVFDSIRGFGKVLHTQPSFANQIVNNNSLNFTPSINYTSDINSLNGVAGSSQSGPLIVSAHSENGGQLPSIEPVLVEKVNDHDMLLDDLRKTEHAEKMKNIRLERRLISVEHKARMGLIKLKSDYIKLKMDFLLQNKR